MTETSSEESTSILWLPDRFCTTSPGLKFIAAPLRSSERRSRLLSDSVAS
jgi:hypothetical protein